LQVFHGAPRLYAPLAAMWHGMIALAELQGGASGLRELATKLGRGVRWVCTCVCCTILRSASELEDLLSVLCSVDIHHDISSSFLVSHSLPLAGPGCLWPDKRTVRSPPLINSICATRATLCEACAPDADKNQGSESAQRLLHSARVYTLIATG